MKDLLPGNTHTNFAITWRDEDSLFSPGRLDFIIYTDSLLNIQGFILDSSVLPQDVLEVYGLQADDTGASDHLPLVADVVIVP